MHPLPDGAIDSPHETELVTLLVSVDTGDKSVGICNAKFPRIEYCHQEVRVSISGLSQVNGFV